MISYKRIAIFKLLLVLLLCVVVSVDAQVRCIEREREALLSFKNGFIHEYGYLSTWQSDECCEWYGVECSNATRHVITLQLIGVTSRGKVGSSLLELHHLNYLDLSWNDFGGLPIPEFISSMKQLQHLYLRNSNFSGAIPPQLGNLTNLHSLDLSLNPLSSENLDWLSSLSLLSYVDLSHIDLSRTNWLPKISNLHLLRELYLSSCSITAFWASSNYSSTSLSILDLSYNQLNGSMPDLRAFSSLTLLDLSGNNFTGSIPLSIGQLSNLEALDLSYNSLEGLVSESHFIKLDKLKRLHLSFNPFLHIASDWSPPFQLSHIYLAGCNVGPYFPKWIRLQRNLSILDLSGAGITDEAPMWLWSTSSLLQYLLLSDNQISGTVPNLSSTSILLMDLSYNQFSGPIPSFPPNASEIHLNENKFISSISSICETPHDKLRILDLSNNQLEGEVPNCWEKMPVLYALKLANNNFSDEIPGSLGALHNLLALHMYGNNLSGELPYNLRLCQKLIFIDVGENKLTGEIPAWIGQMYNMHFLNLRGNKLHGSIPSEICNLTNIQVLDLSINNMSSIIPDCFNNFTILASNIPAFLDIPYFGPLYFGYSLFQWKGQETKYTKNLELLKLIDLSSNRLTGTIPRSFSSMRGLKSLNLSRNCLTGHIVSDIGKMNMLDSLDLSHNQLFGKLPTSLAEIHTLGVLDLSNNNLSGKIPTGTQLQSFNASAYAGNDGLCGDPLAKCAEDSLRPSPTNPGQYMNEKEGSRFSFIQEVGISMAFGFIFGFWGVVGLFILKKSWRIAFFNLLDSVGDRFYVRIALFVSKWIPRRYNTCNLNFI